MSSVANQLAALTGLAQRMEEVVPLALRALDEHLSEFDGMSHGGDDAVVSTSLGSSTVERAALQLATGPYARDRDVLVDGIKDLAAGVHHLLRVAGRYAPLADQRKCDRGTGRVGMVEWGDERCEAFAADDRGGLCLACAKREQRWRAARNMTPRNRSAA